MVEPKELFGKDYEEFCEVDPFNPQNQVEGFISRKATEFYGALLITKINNHKVPEQLIMGTPKMHYPFVSRADGTRNYIFPSAKTIEAYVKLDGTNILSYFYFDDKSTFATRYLTYKTRLRPFVRPGRFGDFLAMWKEVGIPYQEEIKQLMHDLNCNLSFELYGSRNPHLIIYPNALDISLLFGVTNTGNIIPLSRIPTEIPSVNLLKTIASDYVWNYELLQEELQAGLKQEEDNCYSGTEGTVWYLNTPDNRCIQFKCKPDTIEAIHFSMGAGIGRNVIITTCWNAFENIDVLTVDFIKQLLLEEFTPEKIEDKSELIEECIYFVAREAEFRRNVIDDYRKLGMNVLLQKPEVMRAMSEKYAKKDMRKVYSIITGFA
ncbi:MAG: hypothetical protein V3U84_00845 [Thiotrichaceae bacterium]